MRIAVFDSSPLLYQIWNSPQGKLTNGGENTGLRYGFIRGVASYVKRTAASKAVICWDLPGPVKKAEGISEYKENRRWSDSKQKMYDQVPGVKEMMSQTYWAQASAVGYEADDVVGAFARKYAEQGHEIVVVSTDNDLAQLLTPKISIFVPGKGSRFRREEDIYKDFGFYPNALLAWKAAVGDVSDNLKGAFTSSVDTRELLDLLASFRKECLPEEVTTEALRWVEGRFGADSLVLGAYRRNLGVMALVNPPEILIEKGRADEKALRAIFERLAFKSLMDRIPEFCGSTPDVEI